MVIYSKSGCTHTPCVYNDYDALMTHVTWKLFQTVAHTLQSPVIMTILVQITLVLSLMGVLILL